MFDNFFDSKSIGNTPAIIFLDIKKVFDTVYHKVLIEKLKFHGANRTVILWIKNYLSDRKQATKFFGVNKVYFSALSLVFLRIACLDHFYLVFILMILLMHVTCLILTYLLMMEHLYLKISAGKLT